MSFLTSERRSRLRLLLYTLAEGQRDHEEIARLDAQIRLDYHGRFLIELVQNAVDPAQRAGLTAAHILIVSSQDLLAVLNQGAPFDNEGLRSILSLALSSKRPDEAIGNKGVGFKSVFEVAEAADVYGVTQSEEGLSRSPGLRFRVRRTGTALAESLVAEAMDLLADDPKVSARIAARCTDGDAAAAVRRALAASPAWRFPEELAEQEWNTTLHALGLNRVDLSKYQTAVVLRLDPEHRASVDRAVADFTSGGAEAHLFLPAVGRIEIRQAEGTTALERADIARGPESGLTLRRLQGRFPDGREVESWWWLASGVVTGPALEAAVVALPGEGWQAVRRADVQVALPVPGEEKRLEPIGRYYVGLPTREDTGSPFHVDARFHATLSRTGLDRQDNPYNVLLDREAAEVAANLIRALRSIEEGDPACGDLGAARRAVTLALARGYDWAFASAVRVALRDEPVVLLVDGIHFAVPSHARRVSEADAPLVVLLQERLGRDALEEHGVALVEQSIQESSSGLLAELGVPSLKPAELLARGNAERSLVERLAAQLLRPDGGWITLLTWFASRVPVGGEDQLVLPGASGALLQVDARPFLPLVATPEPGELRESEVTSGLLAHLPFIHPAVLEGSEVLRGILTEGKRPLAQRPIPSAVARLAVIPAMNEAIDAGDDRRARDLLTLALGLLASIAESEDVTGYGWRVPCGGGWLAADVAYLGDAWRDGRHDDDPPGVVEAAFGPAGRCLISWWGSPEERASLKTALLRIGLCDSPRVLVFKVVREAIWGDQRRGAPRAKAPRGVPESVWSPWLNVIAALNTIDWGPRTWWALHDVAWVDGLDLPLVGPDVAAWALTLKPAKAKLRPESVYGTRGVKQGAEFLNLWSVAIRRMAAPCVPSHPLCSLKGRLARPGELCRLTSENRHVPAWLPRSADGLDDTALESVGVRSLTEMPASWLVAQLSTFGANLDPARKDSVVARGMWRLLNTRARTEPLTGLADAVLPVWLAGVLHGVEGSKLDRLVVVDNPYAAEVLGDQLDGVHMLEPEAEDWRYLAGRLRESLPSATIEFVSELDFPYEVAAEVPTRQLMDTVAESFGQVVVLAIAALLWQPGSRVGAADAERAWAAFRAAKVQVGVLPESAPAAVWLASDHTLVCQKISPAEVVAETWPVLGSAWRNTLLALGHALGRGDRPFRDFLRHERVTEAMLDEAASRLGVARATEPFILHEGSAGAMSNGAASRPVAATGTKPSIQFPVPDGNSAASNSPNTAVSTGPKLTQAADLSSDPEEANEWIDLDAARVRVHSAPIVIMPDAANAAGGRFLPSSPRPSPRPAPTRDRSQRVEEGAMLDDAASWLSGAAPSEPFTQLPTPGSSGAARNPPGPAAIPGPSRMHEANLTSDSFEPGAANDPDSARGRLHSFPAKIKPDAATTAGGGLLSVALSSSPHSAPARLRSQGEEEYDRQIGHLGELFAFRALSTALPGFDEFCWKSSSRSVAGLPGGDDTLGYDFRYLDIGGMLSGEPGVECFIEVKANARSARRRFALSNNEWQFAVECHASPNRRFVVVRVAGLADFPAIVAVIVDPVRALLAGELALTPKDGWWVDHEVASHPPGLVGDGGVDV